MSSDDKPLDGLFLTAAQRCGGVQELLQEFFSFMHRRTDFYVVDPSPTKPMGFDPGVAEKMVLKSFRAFPMKNVPSTGPKPSPSHVAKSTKPSAPAPAPAAPAAAPVASSKPVVAASSSSGSASIATPVEKAASSFTIRYTPEGKQIPVGNGGIGPNYWWTQTLSEATVYMDVAPGTTSKDVAWTVTSSTVNLALKSQRDTPLLAGELGGSVRPSDCMWSLEDGRTLVLSFEKAVETWWSAVVKGHPEIDAQKVDSTRKVEEYDPETQAAIRKIMFDQAQKAKGLPTSEDIAMQSMTGSLPPFPPS